MDRRCLGVPLNLKFKIATGKGCCGGALVEVVVGPTEVTLVVPILALSGQCIEAVVQIITILSTILPIMTVQVSSVC